MKVSIARLWTSIQEVEIAVGSTAMQALRQAGFDLDSVVSIKKKLKCNQSRLYTYSRRCLTNQYD